MIKKIIGILKNNEDTLKKLYKVKKIGIFGSIVRGEQTENSDVDILIEFKEPISLFEFMDLEDYLTELIGMKIDLVSKNALKPRIGKIILEEVIYI
ncbi:MAG: nucleotidyltransferase family protein [Promethearchaeota archaeon]